MRKWAALMPLAMAAGAYRNRFRDPLQILTNDASLRILRCCLLFCRDRCELRTVAAETSDTLHHEWQRTHGQADSLFPEFSEGRM
jgi:hypothetical protein